jgi:hypothetical protein
METQMCRPAAAGYLRGLAGRAIGNVQSFRCMSPGTDGSTGRIGLIAANDVTPAELTSREGMDPWG